MPEPLFEPGWGRRAAKRTFDVAFALIGLLLTWWLIMLVFLIATISTRKNGFFVQERIGRDGKPFNLIKIRTMRDDPAIQTTITVRGDSRITRVGRVLRRFKLDELPQLMNVLAGDMSFVGPRPDVREFTDLLSGDDRVILTVRPGITGPATLRFRREEEVLAGRADPEAYYREVIWPEKVRLNRQYVEQYRFGDDIRYIIRTLLPLGLRHDQPESQSE